MYNPVNSSNSVIPDIASGYSVITSENLVMWNPAENIPTNKEYFYNNVNYNTPASYATISDIASGYSDTTAQNLMTPNPPEYVAHEQLFPELIYRKISYKNNPNAFVNSHAFMAPIIPEKENKQGVETVANAKRKFDQNAMTDFRNKKSYTSAYVPPSSFPGKHIAQARF